ncbi:type II secretion system minor pseudopilin GspK [Pseudomonas fluorescens]|uniref:type II secretion system minor pseudopilin GspK n=1 Tax=Pseudomonas fluorescens TaxID=294 RepID=UPI001CA77D50|nr:type II secretion system minor pseudopilin GspK [Pseudomonas fluorescens]MBY8938133.1 type II secretion system minor pseudopilin GspK [Pseudomonas fluorescens]
MNSSSPQAQKQRGMAIISALLIAAVVAVIAAGMLTRQSVFTRSLEAEQSRVQGAAALLAGLELSRQLLRDTRQQDVLTRLDQPWAQPVKSHLLNAPGGGFEGRIEDQQGKFNLRNLLSNERVDDGQLRSFERLCEMIGIDAALSQRISQRVIASYPRMPDPQAAGQSMAQTGFDGVRATSPSTRRRPLPATQPMLRSLDDLRGLEGMNEELLGRLNQYVSLIPAKTWVNGNTASAEVLVAVVPGLSLAQARAVVGERDRGQWFINRGDFVNRLHLPHLTVDGLNVGISSDWFLLRGHARRDQRRVSLDALLHRPADDLPKVIWSRLGV